jgi:hypothetical protein
MLLEDAGTSLNKMPKAPLREDQDAFPTFLAWTLVFRA